LNRRDSSNIRLTFMDSRVILQRIGWCEIAAPQSSCRIALTSKRTVRSQTSLRAPMLDESLAARHTISALRNMPDDLRPASNLARRDRLISRARYTNARPRSEPESDRFSQLKSANGESNLSGCTLPESENRFLRKANES
jgi:hypothetical protein